MFSALFSFLGGSVFRMIWGELSSYLNKRQDHDHEIERMRLEYSHEAEAHQRMLESLRLQNELGVKTIEAQREADVDVSEAGAFAEAMKHAFKKTGIAVVDVWNGCIRPAAATIALALWVVKLYAQAGVMDEWDKELTAGVLGFFIADRSLTRRGK